MKKTILSLLVLCVISLSSSYASTKSNLVPCNTQQKYEVPELLRPIEEAPPSTVYCFPLICAGSVGLTFVVAPEGMTGAQYMVLWSAFEMALCED